MPGNGTCLDKVFTPLKLRMCIDPHCYRLLLLAMRFVKNMEQLGQRLGNTEGDSSYAVPFPDDDRDRLRS